MRRVLKIIREEYDRKRNSGGEESRIETDHIGLSAGRSSSLTSDSFGAMLTRSSSYLDYSGGVAPDMIKNVMQAVNELYDEVDNVYQPICELAQEHIHADECILTYGHSTMIEKFLKAAAKKRRFQVIVAESALAFDGQNLARALSKNKNISVTLIPDSNIYAIMARVNKVLFTPVAVMADGGAICSSGHLMVAVAAKEYKASLCSLLLQMSCHH